ncbi:hypothetical protein M9H77_13234 [Catharanthus roseus]|uniref:Uncharacterized protein n=1 Tax=Catharanthus roseus TaxID=4058 RepID=A0ACC0BJR7_CATRO|nr:hypothetical protein M9H77_13234 [Catharanthus roseus]
MGVNLMLFNVNPWAFENFNLRKEAFEQEFMWLSIFRKKMDGSFKQPTIDDRPDPTVAGRLLPVELLEDTHLSLTNRFHPTVVGGCQFYFEGISSSAEASFYHLVTRMHELGMAKEFISPLAPSRDNMNTRSHSILPVNLINHISSSSLVLNIDGVSRYNAGSYVAGGLLQSFDCKFLPGFSVHLVHRRSNNLAES